MRDRVNGALRRIPVWPVYVLGLAPIPWLFWLGATGGLGPEPIRALEHRYGLIGLQVLLAGLCVTPLRRFAGINGMKFRRALGLVGFAFIAAHLAVWFVLDLQSLSRVWADIVKRPYITVGMAGFLCLVPLALTSNDRAVRWLGPRWRRLHRLTYVAVALGAVHYVMQAKGWQVQPLVYLALTAALLGLRIVPSRGRTARPA